jgi:hypothetical protein
MSTVQAPPPLAEQKILFQDYFKSVGTRTYAAQVKEASNGNHFIVLTEGKREKDSDLVRKTKLLVFSEDFEAFFAMVRKTADFVKSHPVPEKYGDSRKSSGSNGTVERVMRQPNPHEAQNHGDNGARSLSDSGEADSGSSAVYVGFSGSARSTAGSVAAVLTRVRSCGHFRCPVGRLFPLPPALA